MTDRTRKVVGILSAAVVLAVVCAAVALWNDPKGGRPPTSAPQVDWYLALGDSYAAGVGVPPFEEGTERKHGDDACMRSAEKSYARILRHELVRKGGRFSARACSGAVIANIFEKKQEH